MYLLYLPEQVKGHVKSQRYTGQFELALAGGLDVHFYLLSLLL